MKKNVIVATSLLLTFIIMSACSAENADKTQQIDDLQKQVEELKKQVEQQNQGEIVSEQQSQPTQAIQQSESLQQQVPPSQSLQQQYDSQNAQVSVEEAKATAVAHSGLDINDVNFVKQKYDFDDGIQEWEIEFVHGTTKYEYAINAMTGAIIKFEMDSIYD